MQRGMFRKVAAFPDNPKWEQLIKRQRELYKNGEDIRSDFTRDYTRIIHCSGYRRLKHKTQVFFSPQSDHICTRIEHVNHVDSISGTIANFLGLNTELTRAISAAHDLGHSPFGHKGERVLSEISEKEGLGKFWHERNGLHFVDDIELLEDHNRMRNNLNLTYAVRDGIISHCGEVDQNFLCPREEAIDLCDYVSPSRYAPYTFEGCIVKMADKISYVGRDLEDAVKLNILDEEAFRELALILSEGKSEKLNNTIIINTLINDICENSSPEKGITLSGRGFELLREMRSFNTKNIYRNKRLFPSDNYFELIINEIYLVFRCAYRGEKTIEELERLSHYYKDAASRFLSWLRCYCVTPDRAENLNNKEIYELAKEEDYCRAIIDYISGMSDSYAIETYNEIISF